MPTDPMTSAARYPKPPLGRVPVLPPTHICRDHDGDRFSGEPCPNCLPIHARPGIAHEPCFQDGHSHDWRDCPTPILAASADVADLDATREVEDV